ncbi:uncharacterized protein LOC124164946, partial [Ischnura elegans]|uniref:uncharacterized protein LOC124164946 n=1 Tax=Ischnura elegans TaxID=197161 RepID=UPI001ED88210
MAEARAEIIGAPDLHLKSGSTLRLSCVLRQSTEPPVYVFWYHDDRMINYDRERGVSVEAERFGSALVVREARRVDSGNYTCVPSNARPASVNVHVLNGEKPAAMQHGSRSGSGPGRGIAPGAWLLAASAALPAAASAYLLLTTSCPHAPVLADAPAPGAKRKAEDGGGGGGEEGQRGQ